MTGRRAFAKIPLRLLAAACLAAAAPAYAGQPGPEEAAAEPAAAPARGLPDDQLAPLSLQMLGAGNEALAASDTRTAIEYFEAALAADPRNRQAYVGLALAAQAEDMPGQAIRYYREALALEPNDINALELQGLALVARGARTRAEENLERLKSICNTPCPPADRLAAAIADRDGK